jgi:hypothetical protein
LILELRLIRGGQNKPLRGIHVPRAGTMTGLATDHQKVLLGARNVATLFTESGDMALEACGITLVLLWKMCKSMSVVGFRPCVRLWAMAKKALIRPDVRFFHGRCWNLLC